MCDRVAIWYSWGSNSNRKATRRLSNHVKNTCTAIKTFPPGTVVSMGKKPTHHKDGKTVYSVRACRKVLVEGGGRKKDEEEGEEEGEEEEDVRLKCKDIEYKISGGVLNVHARLHNKKKVYSIQACRAA